MKPKPISNYLYIALSALLLTVVICLIEAAHPQLSTAIRKMYVLPATMGMLTLGLIWLVVLRPFETSMSGRRWWEKFLTPIIEAFDFMLQIPPSKGYHKFLDFIATLESSPPDSVARSTAATVRAARDSVLERTLNPGSEAFESFIEDMRSNDFPVGARHYQILKYRAFVKTFSSIALAVVAACVAINISVYRLNPEVNFNFNSRDGSLTHLIVDALYFSVTTVSTVGYGDVNPNHGVLAQLAVTFEIATAFIVVVFGFSFGVSLLQVFNVDCDDLAGILRDELEAYSGTGLVIGNGKERPTRGLKRTPDGTA